MKYLITLFYLLSTLPVHATLNQIDKSQIFNKNLLVNGGFENGKAKWTASAGAFTVTGSSPMVGLYHATWDAAAAADGLYNTPISVPVGMYGRNGVASCLVTTASGTADHTFRVDNGAAAPLVSTTVTSSTTPTRVTANFIFPSSADTVNLLFYANSDSVSIAIDDCYIGPAEGYNVGSVSEAKFIGSAYFPTTTNCIWTRTNTALGAPTDTDCTGPTVDYNPGPGTIQTTDTDTIAVTVNSLPPGEYRVEFTLNPEQSSTSPKTYAITDGTSTNGHLGYNGNNSNNPPMTIIGRFNYSNAGDRTFTIHCSATASTCGVIGSALFGTGRTNFYIYRYPLSSEQVYKPDVLASSWSGYHDSTCSWARTNAAYGAPTADATCAFTELTNANFGTVTTYTVVNAMPGIVFTPKKAGRYSVCAVTQASGAANSAVIGLQLTDGTNVLAQQLNKLPAAAAGDLYSFTLCGILNATSTSAITLRVESKASSSAITISGNATDRAINWSIFAIDQSLPAPLLAGSVTSNSSGVLKEIVANLNCDAGSAITSQTGSTADGVASIGNVSGGACAVTLAGAFSSTPYCFAVPNAAFSATGLILSAAASSSTAVSVDCEDDASTACTSFDFNLFCKGAP